PPSTSLLVCGSGFRGRGGTCRRGRRRRYGGLDRLSWRDLAVLHLEDEELRGRDVAVRLKGDVLRDPLVGADAVADEAEKLGPGVVALLDALDQDLRRVVRLRRVEPGLLADLPLEVVVERLELAGGRGER